MTNTGPDHSPDPFEPPVDYPADAGLPPPVYSHPYAVPSGYQQYPPYPPTPQGTNGKAIAALVASITGVICCGVPSIVGLVLGIMAITETRRTGQAGAGLAIAAVVISSLVIAGALLYLIVMALLAGSGWQWAP